MNAAISPILAASLWMVGAIASFSLMAVGGRELAADLDTFEVLAYRSLIGLALVLAVGAATGRLGTAGSRRPGLHLSRNLVHFAGQNFWFYAVAAIPLAQVFALEFTTPIWVALAAPLVLGETMTRPRIVAAGLGFIGVLIVARPGLTPLEFGHLAAFLAAILFAGNVMAVKALSSSEPVWRIMLWMTGMQAVMGLLCAGMDGDIAGVPTDQLGWIAVVGVGGLTAHISMAQALRLAPATVVAPMDFLRLPLIALVGMAVYGEALEVAVFAGAALILAGNLVNIRAAETGAAR